MGPPALLSGPPPPAVALTIAGSDSGGGAGIQADLATFAALGVHGASAVTAVTAQTGRGVSEVHEVPAAVVAEQVRRVCGDLHVGAAKTGMLASGAIIRAVAAAVAGCGVRNLVVDPVLVASSGARLLDPAAEAALVEELLPLALVVTPNLAEAGELSGMEVRDPTQMHEAAVALHRMGPPWVLVTGGHLAGRPVDLLSTRGQVTELQGERVPGPEVHGTGCVLSAAITAHLALGASVPEAVALAKTFVTGAIRHAKRLGQGEVYANPGWTGSAEVPGTSR